MLYTSICLCMVAGVLALESGVMGAALLPSGVSSLIKKVCGPVGDFSWVIIHCWHWCLSFLQCFYTTDWVTSR